MSLTNLLSQYGYAALFAGCILEGETLLLLAGLAAHQGYLSFPTVVFVAFLGGALGDQLLFLAGRRYGERLLGRWPHFESPATRVRGLIDRHAVVAIVGVRFLYGLRLIGPVVIGMTDVPARRFVVLNLAGALMWAIGVAGVGYVFGHAIDWLLLDLEAFERWALVCAAITLGALLVWRWSRRRFGHERRP